MKNIIVCVLIVLGMIAVSLFFALLRGEIYISW